MFGLLLVRVKLMFKKRKSDPFDVFQTCLRLGEPRL